MKICPQCGKQNEATAITCIVCGYSGGPVDPSYKQNAGKPQALPQQGFPTASQPASQLQPKAAIPNALQHLLSDEQDPEAVRQIFERVQQILITGEKVEYIAVQKRMGLNLTPDAAVVTNRRFMIYVPKILGRSNFQDYQWLDLHNAKLNEGVLGATITFDVSNGTRLSIDGLPKVQARKVYRFAQEKEMESREFRRQRMMEEKRAAAGGVILQQPIQQNTPVQGDDPVMRLQQIKSLFDAGLITEEEYNIKKQDILSRI